MRNPLRRILVIRNDRLGDFVLAFPSFVLLKRALPNTEIHALVPAYTEEIAEVCEGIDQTVVDPGQEASMAQQLDLLRRLRRNNYDAVITLYSTTRIGLCTLLAGVPYRLAPATKLAQIFYNNRLKQRRSRSKKPEYEYNLDLCIKFLKDAGTEQPTLPTPPYIHFKDDQVAVLRAQFCQQHGLDSRKLLVFVHPGSGGSANNLTLAQYSQLVHLLSSTDGHAVVVTAGPGEEQIAHSLAAHLKGVTHTVYHSSEGLRRFAKHIQFSDLFVSGSTGPLHIAGALNRPTAAFYPRRRSATALRWQTLSAPERRLTFSPPDRAEESDMGSVDLVAAAETISTQFLHGR
ncbi:MAG: glycosyltransferase family 9 protein [Acidiferrobacterales bacterium]